LYRFLQEALTNVAKHAHASQVWVRVRADASTVSLSVKDDGCGFDVRAVMGRSPDKAKGIGLLGMHERLQSVGGRLEINSAPGEGARLVAWIPWNSID
jgi:two-component system sensor histidine kinase UhpB